MVHLQLVRLVLLPQDLLGLLGGLVELCVWGKEPEIDQFPTVWYVYVGGEEGVEIDRSPPTPETPTTLLPSSS